MAFLDADDWWAAEKVAAQLQAFEADPTVEVVFSDFVHISPDGLLGPWKGGLLAQLASRGLKPKLRANMIYVFDESVALPLIRHTSFMHTSTVLVRREAFEKVGVFDGRLFSTQDLQMWIRLADRCRLAMVDKVLTWAEQHPCSVGHNTRRMAEQLIMMYSTLHEFLPALSSQAAAHIRSFCAREHTGLAWAYRKQGDGAAARQHYWASLRHEFRFVTLLALAACLDALCRARPAAG